MKMKDELKSHVLRTMLLEGEEHPKILAAVKRYQKNPDQKAKVELTENLRKQIMDHAKELMTDDQIEKFVTEIPGLD